MNVNSSDDRSQFDGAHDRANKALAVVPDKTFRALMQLTARMFDVDVSLVTIVDECTDRQVFKGHVGLPEAWNARGETPLSHSFCRQVKLDNAPLRISDARLSKQFKDNPAIVDLGVIAYLGVPVHCPDGAPIGAICVIHGAPREWSDAELTQLQDLAHCVSDQIRLRMLSVEANARNGELTRSLARSRRYSALRESVSHAFLAPGLTPSARFEAFLATGCAGIGARSGRITKVMGGEAEVLFEHIEGGALMPLRSFAIEGSFTGSLMKADAVQWQKGGGEYPDIRLGVPVPSLGAPVSLAGMTYGTLEFMRDADDRRPWDDEAQSMISLMSMLLSGFMEPYETIRMMRATELAAHGALKTPQPDEPA